ncbi:MAG: haloacid dehalogenase-like hydrolase [Desulfobacteraceae bacterium]|nr:haloacid dehalogenase-like hydrolase [Desulfobacteraceae bacterium]
MKHKNLVLNLFVILAGIVIFSCPALYAGSDAGLEQGKWCPSVKAKLDDLITKNAGQGKIVVFDFDNTMICRDIQESTFAAMLKDKKLTPGNIPASISPPFTLDGKTISPDTAKDLSEYYEEFLLATKHHAGEQTPYSNSYAWVVQILAGMSPSEILPYSEKAYAEGIGSKDSESADLKETKIYGYRQPFFYPEMADLAGILLKKGYKVYFVSASNVWSVRWLVLKKLLPMIQSRHGKELNISPDHVIGVSILLKDRRTGKLCKDQLLVKENNAYANLDRKELANYELTTQIVFPLTGYFGKVANIFKHITASRPFLIAGDSPNDLPMLNHAENRLWITRLEKIGYQEKVVKQIKNSLPGEWLMQPVLYKKSPGFVASQADLDQRLSVKPSVKEKTGNTVKFLKEAGFLQDF